MTDEQKKHATFLAYTFQDMMLKKYAKGAEEHGGNLWEKEGLLDMAIDEAIDQVVYLLTLKDQIEGSNNEIPRTGE